MSLFGKGTHPCELKNGEFSHIPPYGQNKISSYFCTRCNDKILPTPANLLFHVRYEADHPMSFLEQHLDKILGIDHNVQSVLSIIVEKLAEYEAGLDIESKGQE